MNLIRSELGIAEITCADYSDILSNLNTIYADFKIVNQLFDPITYSKTEDQPLAS